MSNQSVTNDKYVRLREAVLRECKEEEKRIQVVQEERAEKERAEKAVMLVKLLHERLSIEVSLEEIVVDAENDRVYWIWENIYFYPWKRDYVNRLQAAPHYPREMWDSDYDNWLGASYEIKSREIYGRAALGALLAEMDTQGDGLFRVREPIPPAPKKPGAFLYRECDGSDLNDLVDAGRAHEIINSGTYHGAAENIFYLVKVFDVAPEAPNDGGQTGGLQAYIEGRRRSLKALKNTASVEGAREELAALEKYLGGGRTA